MVTIGNGCFNTLNSLKVVNFYNTNSYNDLNDGTALTCINPYVNLNFYYVAHYSGLEPEIKSLISGLVTPVYHYFNIPTPTTV